MAIKKKENPEMIVKLPLRISLTIDGKARTFSTVPRGRSIRDAVALYEKMTKNALTPELLDEMAAFTVGLYGDKFTADDLYDGIDVNQLGKVLFWNVDAVYTLFYNRVDALPNGKAAE